MVIFALQCIPEILCAQVNLGGGVLPIQCSGLPQTPAGKPAKKHTCVYAQQIPREEQTSICVLYWIYSSAQCIMAGMRTLVSNWRAWICCLIAAACMAPPLRAAPQEQLPRGVSENRTEYRNERGCALRITANVSDVSVFLNGEYQGTTPLYVSGLVPGMYHITLEKRGYETRDFFAQFEDGSIRDFYIEMTAITGFVSFDVEPAAADIFVDGERTARFAELPEGSYTAEIRLFGYETVRVPFTVFRYRTQRVSARLQKSPFRVSDLRSSAARFNPQSPGALGVCTLRFEASAPGTAELYLYSGDTEIRRFSFPQFYTWTQSVEWDGTDQYGRPVPDGEYRLVLSAASAAEAGETPATQTLEASVAVDSSLYYPLASVPSFTGNFFQPDAGRLFPAGSLSAGAALYPFFNVTKENSGYAGMPVVFYAEGSPADWIELRLAAGFSLSPEKDESVAEYIAASVKAGIASSFVSGQVSVRYGYSGRVLFGGGRIDSGQGLGIALSGGIMPGGWYIGARSEYLWGIERGLLNDGTMLWKNSLLVQYQHGGIGAALWASAHSFFSDTGRDWLSGVSFGLSVSVMPGSTPFIVSPGLLGFWDKSGVCLGPSCMFSIMW